MEGARMVFGDRRLRAYVVRPMLLGALAFIVVIVVAYLITVPLMSGLADRLGAGSFAQAIATVAFVVTVILLSGSLYLAIVSLLSGLLWDKLSLMVEREKMGTAPEASYSSSQAWSDSIRRAMLAGLAGVTALCCGWPTAGVLPVLLAGYVGLLDYTSPAYLRRGMFLRDQRKRVFKLKSAREFFLVAGLVTLVPVLNVIMLPALVAGATLMVAREENG